MPAPRPIHSKLGILAIAAAVTSVFFIDFCNLIFQCGCRSLWAGAADHCNIHMVDVPHCPWCSSAANGYIAHAFIVAAQAVVAFWPGALRFAPRMLAALAAFPVAGGIAAAISGWLTGYWR